MAAQPRLFALIKRPSEEYERVKGGCNGPLRISWHLRGPFGASGGEKWPLGKGKKGGLEYDTWGSRVIPDLSTNQACCCLTSQIGRDTVFSAKYGRTRRCGLPRPGNGQPLTHPRGHMAHTHGTDRSWATKWAKGKKRHKEEDPFQGRSKNLVRNELESFSYQ